MVGSIGGVVQTAGFEVNPAINLKLALYDSLQKTAITMLLPNYIMRKKILFETQKNP